MARRAEPGDLGHHRYSFGVANAISIPITGWLAKRVGEVKLFLWSTTAFAIASWACGVSSSLTMLIFFRVIQGIVAGPLIPLCRKVCCSATIPRRSALSALAGCGQ
ncbi:MFS transporter [Klebsiella pneumoniae]|nr:MFS transporter [Klebsiella pneumoniae]